MNPKHLLGLFFLLQVAGDVFAVEDNYSALVKACQTNDIECLSQSTEMFLNLTQKGIPDYNIQAIDPLVIPLSDIVFDQEGLTFEITNLTITGLKNQKLSDFKMDTAAKTVELTTKADLHMSSDIIIIFTKSSKNLGGHYTSQENVLCTATYNYELNTGSDGVKRFHVGPETISCKVVGTPEVKLNPELSQALANDADAKAFSEDKWNELFKKSSQKAAEEAYKYIVHNIRAAAIIIPASSFFTDI